MAVEQWLHEISHFLLSRVACNDFVQHSGEEKGGKKLQGGLKSKILDKGNGDISLEENWSVRRSAEREEKGRIIEL